MDDVVTVLIVIIVANGAPILLRRVLGLHLLLPVDFGWCFFDGRPLFGSSKTWIGLGSILLAGIVAALLLGMELRIGLLISAGVIGGDLFSSFIKRRLGMKVSSMAVLLDQVPESLFPYLLVMDLLELPWREVGAAVLSFTVFELLISRFLYWIHIRKQPY